MLREQEMTENFATCRKRNFHDDGLSMWCHHARVDMLTSTPKAILDKMLSSSEV